MLSSLSNRTDSTGSDSTLNYPFDFKVFEESHLLVVVQEIETGDETELVLDTDYTVDGVGDTDGGSITLTDSGQAWIGASTLKEEYAISIVRNMPIQQTSDIRNQGDFYPEVHEDTFDKMVMLVQQMQDMLDRSLKVRTTDYTSSLELPTVADRAGNFLAFDSNGDPIASTAGLDTGVVPVTAYTITLLAAATAAAARIVLGFTSGTVPTALIADLAVTAAKLGALAVTTAKIDALAVTAAKLAADAVTTAKILDLNVTKGKLALSAKWLTNQFINDLDYVVVDGDEAIFMRAITTDRTCLVPSYAANLGREITINKVDTDLNFKQVKVYDGAGSLLAFLSTPGESITIVAETSQWRVKHRSMNSMKYAFTPTGSWLVNTTYSGFWWRSGIDRISMEIKVLTTGAPTSAALNVAIPTGLTVNATNMVDAVADQTRLAGSVYIRDFGTDRYNGAPFYHDTTSIAVFKDDGDATFTQVTQALPITFAVNDYIIIYVLDLPVSGGLAAWS